jgi:hypothetical protein
MSFRVKVVKPSETSENPQQKKVYSQTDIDLIDEKFKIKDKIFDEFVNKPANVMLHQYRKNLDSSSKFKKETLKFDEKTGKWFIEIENDSKEK